ncbi:MAG: hypothetical protein COU10_01535 [Candidatus Harrisonbacteria bacterium CG10_big_fil_rev_8_21_14_0_10_45_28]|uniref:Phosphoribosyltransferase domain-containing protein n=1 Tax=Candidatus Harrisonbacteria bacterium CG10_big_fil_rev_8_21_14_0_10_45_28 TaxID=1974586 RepID=A0A2H0UQR1_9BACT|nr:MAG: hypothetical protein COU10_01535 [Candidatus Harrisonbacteria bacterium CG10_big_fil_rev_8_21_14_0_10_45_28]
MKINFPLWESFLDILFPASCLNCHGKLSRDREHFFICRSCLLNVELASGFVCPKCGGRLPELQLSCHGQVDYILACPTSYDNLIIKKLIWQFKFKGQRKAVLALSAFLSAYLEDNSVDLRDFLVLPIPLFSARRKSRGFNQAELLARAVGEYFGLVVDCENLVRIRNTKTQLEFNSLGGRRENVAGCFKLLKKSDISGRNIVLVDDVWTTGSTMNEAARILKRAGARKIIAITVARA